MNPRGMSLRACGTYSPGFAVIEPESKSQFDIEMENAKQYFGEDFPGHAGLTCQKCGAAVNLGWQHIEWHERRAS